VFNGQQKFTSMKMQMLFNLLL